MPASCSNCATRCERLELRRTSSPSCQWGSVASVESKIRQAWSMRRRCRRVPALKSSFAGFRFAPDVITLAVRWYLRYGLSYRDVEELLVERGITVDHVSIFHWVSASRRYWRRQHAHTGTVSATAGGSTRPTSKSPVGGAMSTGQSISSGRSSTYMCPCGEMAARPGVSSPGRWPPRRPFRWRSPLTGRRCTRMFLMSWPRVPGTVRSSTPTTQWKQITGS
jgi:hypothetical protein